MKKHPDSLHSFANLPPEVETELRSLLKVRTFSSGETIFMQDEIPDAVYLVASGRVKVIRVTQRDLRASYAYAVPATISARYPF